MTSNGITNSPTRSLAEVAGRGLLAGATGTLALTATETLVDRRVLGRAPVYAASRIAERLARRFGLRLGARRAKAAGLALRWTYGPMLGLAFATVEPRWSRHRGLLVRAAELGAALFTFELIGMPAVGATPPLADWPRRERLLLGLHIGAFALAAGALLPPRRRA